MAGIIKTICISDKKGTPKVSVNSATLIANHGIDQDAHAGPWHRQVSMLDCKDIYQMREILHELDYGDFAENLALEGISLSALGLGSRLLLGTEAQVQITQIGKVCHERCSIFYKTGDCIMPWKGLFARVLTGGNISVGDQTKVLELVAR